MSEHPPGNFPGEPIFEPALDLESGGAGEDPWHIDDCEPTTLIAFWPGEQPLSLTELAAALAAHFEHSEPGVQDDELLLEGVEPDSEEVRWAAAFALPGLDAPAVIWTQPAAPIPPGELGDAAAESCRWVVGAQTVLNPEDPLTDFVVLLRAIAGALPDVPVILDVNSTRCHDREALDELLSDRHLEPPAEDLWNIHVVAPEGEAGPPAPGGGAAAPRGIWLHTHGLRRCGRPELEMLDLPAEHGPVAAGLLSDIASLTMEAPLPPPGEPLTIGDGLAVTFQPWKQAVEHMPADAPGGADDRSDDPDDPHTGVRAVVCDPEQRGAFRRLWAWPKTIIERIMAEDAVIFHTERASRRQAAIARARWGELATAFSAARAAGLIGTGPGEGTTGHGEQAADAAPVTFLVQAGYEFDGGREHVWFTIAQFDGDRAAGRLLNRPRWLEGMEQGERHWITREAVSDWQVQMAGDPLAGRYGPDDVRAMWRALDAMRQGPTTDGHG